MDIVVLNNLTQNQLSDLQSLLFELVPGVVISPDQIKNAIADSWTHVFAAIDEGGHIRGCAVLCICTLLTGKQATVENVIVSSSCRGKHVGRSMMEFLIDYARTHYGDMVINLTSNPKRIAANNLYRSLGFQQRETNVYKLAIRR